MKKSFLICAALSAASLAHGQLVVNNTLTVEELVQQYLLGQGVTVSNITFNGQPGNQVNAQIGGFNGSGCNVGMAGGIVFCSGDAQGPIGPNDSSGNTEGGGNVDSNDPDLETIIAGEVNDAAVLEFDFIATGDSIKFNYVFGSDEYLEYVGSFNDVFGFFLSGPGINGPYTNNAINIALVPGTNTPVSINNVNDVSNSQFYVNNGDGFTPPMNADPSYIQYDGFTVVLTARAAVQCGQTYHIKLAVADAAGGGFDTVLDSGVFLEEGSFTSSPFIPDLAPGPGIVGDTLYESCFDVTFLFTRTGDSTNAATINLQIGGTSTPGVDYQPLLPNQLTFAPLQTEIPVQLHAFPDADGLETLVITVASPSTCGADSLVIPYTFYIDQPDPLIVIGDAFLLECGESANLVPSITGGYGAFHYQWSTGASSPTLFYTPVQVADVTVLVTDTCGVTSTGFFAVELTQPPPISASITGPDPLIEGCSSATVTIHRPAGTTGDLLITTDHSGTASVGGDYSITDPIVISGNDPTATALINALEDNASEGEESVVITANYTNACQQAVSATVSTNIVDAPPLELSSPSPMVVACGSDSIPLLALASGGVGSLEYQWTNGYTSATTYVPNNVDAYYTVTVTDDCGHSRAVEVLVDPQCEIIIPNVISPNGDGQNDVFYIQGILATKSTVRIFNRWGQVVFEQVNYQNNWSAPDLPDGTYFYEVHVDSKPDPYTGTVTVLSNDRR